jgi:topoisomerase (DNA) II binding protein 1
MNRYQEWIYRCVEENKILDISSCILFTPLPFTVPYDSCKSLLVSLTGFRDEERENIQRLLSTIGISCTDKLTSKNTHLICKDTTGAKYATVIKWKCKYSKPVSVDWLYDTAKQVSLHSHFFLTFQGCAGT